MSSVQTVAHLAGRPYAWRVVELTSCTTKHQIMEIFKEVFSNFVNFVLNTLSLKARTVFAVRLGEELRQLDLDDADDSTSFRRALASLVA
jgi:hypothetical protein